MFCTISKVEYIRFWFLSSSLLKLSFTYFFCSKVWSKAKEYYNCS